MTKYLSAIFITDENVLNDIIEQDCQRSGYQRGETLKRFPVQIFGSDKHTIKGEAQAIMSLIGLVSGNGEDGLISVKPIKKPY